MERTRKSWGEKENIFCNDLCEVSVLRLEPMNRCSWHRHQAKFNLFYVLEGSILIKMDEAPVRVDRGQTFTTRPGEWHEFQTGEHPALVIEVMYVKYEAEDIERQSVGGKCAVDSLSALCAYPPPGFNEHPG